MNKVNEIKCNNCEEMVEVMLEMLKEHTGNWSAGWSKKNGAFANYVTGKEYSGGSNLFTLWLSSMIQPKILGQERSYYYVTSKQVRDLGWSLNPECKTWSKDNEVRREKIQELSKKLMSTTDKEEIEALKKEISNLRKEIRTHQIWDSIIFYLVKYYQIVKREDKYFKQEMVYSNGNYVVKKEREVTEEYALKHPEALDNIDTEVTTHFYTIAPIEYFVGDRKIKKRRVAVNNYGTEKTFKELWDTLSSYLSTHNIKVVEKETNDAFYDVNNDSITLPLVTQFEDEATALDVYTHEVMHSTGAKSRLNRNLSGAFGTSTYAKEELVAEFGSLFFMIESSKLTEKILDNKLSYIKGYLKRVRESNDTNNLIYGINNGRKAFEYVVGADEDYGGGYEE